MREALSGVKYGSNLMLKDMNMRHLSGDNGEDAPTVMIHDGPKLCRVWFITHDSPP